MNLTIKDIIELRESEDKVEFKEAKGGNISYNGGSKPEPSKRRRCILGYVTAFANEGGGHLIFGVKEGTPNIIVGTSQNKDSLGELEGRIYNDTGIRVTVYELYDQNEKRVVVIDIPARPTGKVYKFEDVALMRVGEELKPMSDGKFLKIIQEQEPDFSQKICRGATLNDLDENAIQVMKRAYARKQNNPLFETLDDQQALSDLNLLEGEKVTNAAIILVGKQESIKRYIPQATIRLEFRKNENQITFDNRHIFESSFFNEVNKLWETINLRNTTVPMQEGLFIFDIPAFNEEAVREAINNAVAHRNYHLSSEVVIKQCPTKLDIINPGGFPMGVTLENLLTVPSTPRNRLLTDVLERTGVVERSGQGVDKIYYQSLKEGKKIPDYSKSDDFQVELQLSAIIEDKAFAVFIQTIQGEMEDDQKLSVMEVIHLNNVRLDNRNFEYDKKIIKSLIKRKLIEKHGKTRACHYTLSHLYYEYTDKKGEYSKHNWDDRQAFSVIVPHLIKFEKAKMKDFVDLFDGRLSRKQVRNLVQRLVNTDQLQQHGVSSGTFYTFGDKFIEGMNIVDRAIDIGMKKLKEDGEI